MRSRSKEGRYRIPDGDTADSLSLRLAYDIERSMVKHMKHNSEYKEKVRSIAFNVKKNQSLLERLLIGTLNSDDLVQMSTDDMASAELQRQMAAMKEEADKQAILIKEEGPRLRKTHKGEELIGDEVSIGTHQNDGAVDQRSLENRNANGKDHYGPLSPRKATSTSVEESISQAAGKKALRVNTTTPLRPNTHERKSSDTFSLQRVWSSAQSPGSAGSRSLQQPLQRQSSSTSQPAPALAEEDADIDRLLNDEDHDSPPYSPSNFADPSVVWRGKMIMTNLIDSYTSAKFVAGGDIGKKIPWIEVIPQVLHISGRIGTSTADEYVASMRHTTTTDVACLAIEPVDERTGRPQLERLFSYLHQRSRWGVVSQYVHPAVKDIYVVPIEAGTSELPKFIGFLHNCTFENPRPRDMIILTLIVKTQSPVPSALATPQHDSTSPNTSDNYRQTRDSQPVTSQPAAPQMSPAVTTPAQQTTSSSEQKVQLMDGASSTQYQVLSQSQHVPHANSTAARILGPFVNLPIVDQLLTAQPDMSEHQMRNLRDIVERVPAARNDLNTFQAELFKMNISGQH